MTQSSSRPPVPPPTTGNSGPTVTNIQTSETSELTQIANIPMSLSNKGQIPPRPTASGTVFRPPAPPAPPPLPPPPTPIIQQQPRRGGRAPGHPSLEQLIRIAFDEGYSDLHLGVGEKARMRDRGEIITLDYPVIDTDTFFSWVREILSEEEILRFKKELEFDGATQYEFARVRINIFDSLTGPAMVLRLIPLKILTMEQLRLPMVFQDVSDVHKGLILITGPTGSGKSTTLAAMIDYINKEHPKHIITIEDPVEFVHQSRRSLIKQREVGMHTHKFDNALKAALREDPDIILVGEMRDKETMNTALKAAQTGHLVFGTLHTNSAVKTLERILTLYTADEREAMRVAIAESLVAIIAQGLCRTTDGKRAAYHDIMVNTETVKDYIRQGKNDEILELMRDGEYDGMITTNQSLFNLYQEGRITEETAMEMSPIPNELAMMLRGKI
ncbi:type IV pili twitching motility protein PilT [Aphanothece hegewaldii CCALA 016]|uniref:Type IV pili twitching motility protein PilT n=1 Tax=Aphanothece hegewaldii CCALA 016 TaxID=2107694 RepID=A0A2T1LSV6_9CHRO|nr:type IV pilus twitching motility protein PilT [Aphanothece hegewaldii]PSF33116.1 type IV pili twitching motility protein PilT [Aphanothece hegewaldii CCALA 016]